MFVWPTPPLLGSYFITFLLLSRVFLVALVPPPYGIMLLCDSVCLPSFRVRSSMSVQVWEYCGCGCGIGLLSRGSSAYA